MAGVMAGVATIVGGPMISRKSAVGESDLAAEFHEFFEDNYRELARFAYLLTGDRDAADDVAAEAFTAAWRRWDRVRTADSPLAYVRRTIANMASSRIRRIVRERKGMAILGSLADGRPSDADVPAVIDVRAALLALPARKRACVVLRYAFDLSEDETAKTLGVSVGTVKSQTSKAVGELERLLGHDGSEAAHSAGDPGMMTSLSPSRPSRPARPVAASPAAAGRRPELDARPQPEGQRRRDPRGAPPPQTPAPRPAAPRPSWLATPQRDARGPLRPQRSDGHPPRRRRPHAPEPLDGQRRLDHFLPTPPEGHLPGPPKAQRRRDHFIPTPPEGHLPGPLCGGEAG